MPAYIITLRSLPDEILLEIFEQTPHSSYASLARVCHSFHALIIPLLYRVVYYSKLEYAYDRENHDNRHSRSRIYLISALAYTIESRPLLAKLIKHASFEWHDGTNVIDNRIIPTISQSLPSFEQLHLSSLRNMPLFDSDTALITSLKITSSALRTGRDNVNEETLFGSLVFLDLID